MTVDFTDYFWGDKNNGYDVLYHNMKYGLVASKELSDFFRERSNVEENYSKLLSKLAKQASSCCMNGTFAPLWQILKATSERLATLHMQMVHKVSELVKDINKYTEELHKKHKIVKEDESGTLEAVQAIQSTTLMVQKAKDLYTQKGLEVDKLKKESASPKDIEKAELKLKKAYDDYKIFVEKYSVVKEDFERKMSITCRHFQEIEEAHLIQMKEFLQTYCEVVQTNHDLVGQVQSEFKRQCIEMSVEKLLETFVLNKYTGLEKPGAIELEDFNILHQNVAASKSASLSASALASASTSLDTDKDLMNAVSVGQSQLASANDAHAISHLSSTQGKPSKREGSKEMGGECHSSAPSSPSIPTAPAAPGLTIGDTQNHHEAHITRNPLRGSKWFLRSRRDKVKLRKTKSKKKDNIDNTSNKEEKSDMDEKEDGSKSAVQGGGAAVSSGSGAGGGAGVASESLETPTTTNPIEVDEDGFSIRPKSSQVWSSDKNSFYSSSDSDSDDEREQKIRVEIKPLNNGSAPMSASVDELRATVGTLSLSPLGTILDRRCSNFENQVDLNMKRSQSVSQQLGSSKVSSDLLGLNLQSPGASNASTPTASHPYAPLQSPSLLQSPSQTTMNSPTLSSSSRYADLGDLFSEVGDIQVNSNTNPSGKATRQTPTPTSGYMSIPRPPSRRSDGASPRGRISPATISRADSVGSLEFRTACVPVGVSRGPSPLTIGMADTIPLAVAFHEIVHSYFRGVDETKCQVKMSGDMMLSFPAGIVTVLANNPNPAKLVFRVKNTQRLNSIIPNKQLVTIDTVQSGSDNLVLEFNMSALSALLKRQSEQNPGASYFNVDILKYQVKAKPGANSCPFQLVAYWKCESTHTDLKIDYKYNSHAMSSPSPLLNVLVVVPIDGGVKSMQSRPVGQWISDTNRVIWKFTELSQHSENYGIGCMRARFDLETGPTTPATISTQFNCEGTTLSGIDFQLIGPGYRLSLVKRRFISGKYICDGNTESNYRYNTPPSSTADGEC